MKYIIFDLDDTLLNNKREISLYTREVLLKLQTMGHKLVYNTARSTDFCQKYFEQLRPDYAILNGGALIIDREQKILFRAEPDVAVTQAMIRDLLELTEVIFVQTVEDFYSHKGRKTVQKFTAIDFSKEEFLFPAQKIVTEVVDEDKAKALAEKYNLAFTTYMGGTFRRYTHIDATKARANRNLMKLVGGTLEEVIAFGDDFGDLDMLLEAGAGVMMKNGRPELLGKTSHISEYTNDEDGVARFLEKWFGI